MLSMNALKADGTVKLCIGIANKSASLWRAMALASPLVTALCYLLLRSVPAFALVNFVSARISHCISSSPQALSWRSWS